MCCICAVLSYQLSRLKEHLFFLDTIVQPCVRLSGPSTVWGYDAVIQMASGLVRQACAKVAADVPLLLQQEAALMATIREVISFDASLAALLQAADRPSPQQLQHVFMSPSTNSTHGPTSRWMLSCLEGMYVCMYVCVHIRVHIHTYIHTYIYLYTHTHTHTHTHICMYVCVYIYICIYVYICMYVYM